MTSSSSPEPGRSLADAYKLLQLLDLVTVSIRSVIRAWAAPAPRTIGIAGDENLASWELFQAQRTLLSATGVLTELIANPSSRLLEVSSQYNESRALHIVAGLRVPDLLAEGSDSVGRGLHVEEISKRVGIESRKLSRLLRCLCSIHILQETQTNVFANSRISAALVGNEPLRAYIMLFGFDLYTASDHLPRTMLDPGKGKSYDVVNTAFQSAVDTSKPRWEWLEEKIPAQELLSPMGQGYPGAFGPDTQVAVKSKDSEGLVKRPELATFGLAMLGGGRVTGTAHLFDFPWADLGEGLVVDVGGGVGGFCLQLSHLYPSLRFIIQDRAPVLEQAKAAVWPKENPEAVESGRVSFVAHDFFIENPVKGADIYWLRYIIHDWSDDYCVRILAAIRAAMAPQSRILICDQVMNTTLGSAQITPAPAPLPANYGSFTRWSHQRDITMMSIINGIERTPAEFGQIIEKAGLVISKIYACRSQVSLVECVLPGALCEESVNGKAAESTAYKAADVNGTA
ncbi:MAG: hypothetical protein Q9219_003932 [cf. Caloplaca sp. 3 TL-2023]